MMVIPARIVYTPLTGDTRITGNLIVIKDFISPYGDIDYRECTVVGRKAENYILAVKGVVGSTVGSYVIYGAARNCRLKAIIIVRVDPITVTGAVISRIPLLRLEEAGFEKLNSNCKVEISLLDDTKALIKIVNDPKDSTQPFL